MANDSLTIKALISVLRDGEKGYADIGQHIDNPQQKTFFLEESKVRGSYATELESAVNRGSDADVHETGTTLGTIHRVFGDLLGKLGGGDHSLLKTAVGGEEAAKKAYQEALEDTTTSDTVRAIIAKQSQHVTQARGTIEGFSKVTA